MKIRFKKFRLSYNNTIVFECRKIGSIITALPCFKPGYEAEAMDYEGDWVKFEIDPSMEPVPPPYIPHHLFIDGKHIAVLKGRNFARNLSKQILVSHSILAETPDGLMELK